ncbi:MAG: zinc-dependent metalloprotease [Marinicella sp.]
MTKYLSLILLLSFSLISLAADQPAKNINEFTANMSKEEGFVDFYWDENNGKIYLEIDRFDQDLLYVYYLQSGVGSNDIGLDRGQIGGYALVQFKRYGNKVMMIEPNLSYRAHSENPAERQAVADGFAQSVLWGGDIQAAQDETVLVDWTNFLLRDSQGIQNRLAQMEEGQFAVDPNRSAIYMENSKNFPENTEFEALITLQGSKPGNHIRSVAPTSDIISIRTHHSLVKLPEEPYQTRNFDPRSGGIPISFKDYAVPLGESMNQQWVIRHRLEKQDPSASVSEVVAPIVYYLDPGTPEPVRSALLDGAKWWEAAFESAGFKNAFKVELLPPGADPLDIRYNTIQWVHRSTRGWSYGASIVDPRSGEILKGHVTLGSLRVRQDMLLAQSLLSPYDGIKDSKQLEADIQNMALARLRQLSAHEVGHTLGLIHNFYTSSKDRASVMDYPHPLVKIGENGTLDLSDAYDVGIGDWDKVSLAYLYQDFGTQDETTQLNQLLDRARADGHVFIADRDARTPGGSQPFAHLWDNGADAAQGLTEVLQVRRKALNQLGINTIKTGEPVSLIERHLVPVYLFHRYQTEAAIKLIAGVDYRYAIKGETDITATMVEPESQLKALDTVLQTLSAETLALPENLLPYLLPPAEGTYRDREHFKHRTGLNFDALGAAETAATHTLKLLLNSARANRLVEHHARKDEHLSLHKMLDTLWNKTWEQNHKDNYHQAIQDSINWVTLNHIIKLAADKNSAPITQAKVMNFLQDKQKSLQKSRKNKAFNRRAALLIKQFIENPELKLENSTQPIPPGSPIGMD